MSEAQTYTISASSYDSSSCVVSEPEPNNSQEEAVSIRESANFTGDLNACSYDDGAGGTSNDCHMCNQDDDDWYHLGKLFADQTIIATLTHVAADGVLGMELRAASTPDAMSYYKTGNTNSLDEDVITMEHTESANILSGSEKDYYVKVKTQGTEGYQAQVYQLTVSFSEACFPDSYELVSSNNYISTATLGRDSASGDLIASTIEATLCSGDKDYFKYFLVNNETITVTPQTDNVEVALVDEEGTVIAEIEEGVDGGPSADSVSHSYSGFQGEDVYLKIQKVSGSTENNYTVTVAIE